MIDTTTRQSIIDALFAPLETRPVTLTRPEIVCRRADYAIGDELARIQGARPSATSDRILTLVVQGQATPQEAMRLGAELARRGLLSHHEASTHDR